MDIKAVVKKVVEVQKTSFDNGYEALVTIQDNTEKMMKAILTQAPLIPQENKEALDEWVKMYRKGRDDFKHVLDDGYAKVEKYMSSTLNI